MNEQATKQAFAKRIRQVRGDRTMAQFGESIRTSKAAISLWEMGEQYPKTMVLMRISEIENVSIDWLLFGDEV